MSIRAVKVFIASSEELKNEREKFDSLLSTLDNIFEKQGIQLKTVKWEQLDSSQGPIKKQEEYNREIKKCDVCVVMFWRKFGEYTEQELNIANAELRKGRKPHKIYVFFKEIGDISEELKKFKDGYSQQYGHYYNKFKNTDQLKLDFTLQLVRFLHSNLVWVENCEIKINDIVIAHLDNINFAANNDKYKCLRNSIKKLVSEISNLEKLKKGDEDCPIVEELLNSKRQDLDKMQAELRLHEMSLLDAAVYVAQFIGERVSDRTHRAIELFEQGKVNEACTILYESKLDANKILEGIQDFKQTGKQSIEELILNAHYTLLNTKYSIEERIIKSEELYEIADKLAEEVGYEKEKYDNLLYEYGAFLELFSKYSKAEDIYIRLISLREGMYGDKDLRTASAYNRLGTTYFKTKNIDSAYEFCYKALKIQAKVLGCKHPETAKSYRIIGQIYSEKADFNNALKYLNKYIAINKELGYEDPDIVISHHDLATAYLERFKIRKNKADFKNALESYRNALQIHKKTKRGSFSDCVDILYNLGHLFTIVKSYDNAIENYMQALDIIKKTLGSRHLMIADSYTNLGTVYVKKGDYSNGIEYFHKALEIVIDVFGIESLNAADLYHRLCITYLTKKDIDNALEYFEKGLQIYQKSDRNIQLDIKYIETIYMIASIYRDRGDLYSALRYFDLTRSLCFSQLQNKSNTKE